MLKTSSVIGEYQTTSAMGSFARRLGIHWFTVVRSGFGYYSSVGGKSVPGGVGYLGSSALGYKTRNHTWIATYARSLGDMNGLASASTSFFSGSWNWGRPGLSWRVYAYGGQQRLSGGALGDGTFWQASAGLSRGLSR